LPNYKLLIEYDGRSFEGWQRQKHTSNTIQEKLEKAIQIATREEHITLIGSGRTDSGVSAYEQVANFHIDSDIVADKFIYSVNSLLPKEITVKEVAEAPDLFHARYSAIRREYVYRCTTIRKSIDCDFYYFVKHEPDFDLIRLFLNFAAGLSSFRTFCKNKHDRNNFFCRIDEFRVDMKPDCKDFLFTISADRFLHSMVRALIGCALDLSRGRFEPDEIFSKSLRGEKMNIFFIPPQPLFLNKITY
jgi:tRNA pseudouridine38-40 synthase